MTTHRDSLETSGTASDAGGDRRTIGSVLVMVGLFYVGLSALLFQRLDVYVWRFQLIFVVAAICAVAGRNTIRFTPSIRAYLVWAIPLCVWILLSCVAAWSNFTYSLHYARSVILIFAILVPTFAGLTSHRHFRSALVFGIVACVTFLAIVACDRLVRGVPIYDLNSGLYEQLYGTGRNAINALALATLPFVLSRDGPRFVNRLRWPILVLGVTLVVASGGRSGLGGLVFGALAFLILEPGVAARARAILAIVVAALVVVLGVQQAGGQAETSYQRVVQYIHGTRTTDEEIRNLLLKKAWQLTTEHPLFGVGYYRFPLESASVVASDAQTQRGLEQASFRDSHNAYTQLMSETGFPGFLLFVVMLFAVLRRAWFRRDDRTVRMSALALAGVMFQMLFMNLSVIGVLYIPLALLLGRLQTLERDHDERLLDRMTQRFSRSLRTSSDFRYLRAQR